MAANDVVEVRKQITNVNDGDNVTTLGVSQEVPLGDLYAVAYQAPAAGANPTKAEYDALLAALIASGLMKSA